MRFVLRHLILAPFALSIITVYPLHKALDWAMGDQVVGSLRHELGRLYR